MKCKHQNRRFITMFDYRGFPEKLFVCEDCGITISDYILSEEWKRASEVTSFVPSLSLEAGEEQRLQLEYSY